MSKKNNVRRVSDKKKKRPKIRFNIWMLVIIFALSFAGCFILYMAAANLDENFFDDESSSSVSGTEVSGDQPEISQDETSSVPDESKTESVPEKTDIVYPVPESAAVDASYLESCCMITDSTLLRLSANTDFKDIIGSSSLGAASVNTQKIESNYGTLTAYEIIKLKKPMNLYIMLGSDLGTASEDEMISSIMSLVSNLKNSLPGTKIYVMQLPPAANDAEKNVSINNYNSRLMEIAKTCGVYCLDTNTGFKNNEGSLKDDYISAEDGSDLLNSTFYKDICGYILTHTS